MRGTKFWLARLGLVFVGAIIGGTVTEAVLAARGTIPLEKSALRGYHEHDPIIGWIGTASHEARFRAPEFDIVIANSELGYRRPEVAFEGPDDARKIVFFGDSFTWGWGVEQGEVFTDRLQERFQGDTRILNRGVNAFGQAQQRHLLDRVLVDDKPDAVVVMFFANDPQECVDDRGGKRPVFTLEDGKLVPHNVPVRKKLTGPFREFSKRSIVLSLLRSSFNHLTVGLRDAPRDWFKESQEGILHEGWPVCRALLLDMKRTCEAAGVEFRIVFIPIAFEVTSDESLKLPLRAELEALCVSEAISWLDLTSPMHKAWEKAESHTREGLPFYFPKDQHWTAAGHDFAAEKIHEWWNAK